MRTLQASKDAEFYVDVQSINLPYLCDKMYLKKLFQKNMVNCDLFQFFTKSGSFFRITFYRCILSLRKVYIFETSAKFCVI
jgi:hypothetical protein